MANHSRKTIPLLHSSFNTYSSAFFKNITYVAPKVPTLYTVLTTGADAVNPLVYGEFSHPFVLEKDHIIEIVVNNLGRLPPFNLPDNQLMIFR
jgi:hypothetical protein